jgi:predicted CoA-binding protein
VLDERGIDELLKEARVIAMVGLSPDESKASNRVAHYLTSKGYRVIPVNPGYDEILGEKSYKSLKDIPEKIDIVDVFMRPDRLLPVAQEAVAIRPRAIWLQLGIVNEDARRLVEENGISFVQDR